MAAGRASPPALPAPLPRDRAPPAPTDASRTLVGDAAEGELPESVAELLAERAGGNPFFLEEAFRDLVERGALRRKNGSWELGVELDELAIPALVQGALQARLDRLDPKTREVLLLAAVIGRTFGTQLLERLVPHEELSPRCRSSSAST